MKIFWTREEENFMQEELSYKDTYEENSQECLQNDFQDNNEAWQIALDIIENEDEIVIISPIAWVDLDDIDVSLKDWVLIISWERRKPLELYLNGSILRVWENFWWKFYRTVILPENLDLDNIKAVLEKNILIIKIPKLKFLGKQINIEKKE